MSSLRVCLVGLGYVGLPLAVAFGKKGVPTFGFDVSKKKITELQKFHDATGETNEADLRSAKLKISTDSKIISEANFIIVAVPTPVDEFKKPDLSLIESAAKLVGQNLQKNSVVVLESTVYPGVTEDVMLPIIEKESGLKCPQDFQIGYSPERINPGDKEHTIYKIIKVVSGCNKEALEKIASTYSLVVEAGVHRAPNIKTAEAAKVIENTQRDLNIALMNELALIFDRIGIDTNEVLQAANTKWNFLPFKPGLVGGHCIGVDPYYLVYKAEGVGYHPEVIAAGRRVNDFMPVFIVQKLIKQLLQIGKNPANAKVLILGLTFKENVPDCRNSRVKDIIEELKSYKISVLAHDPLLSSEEAKHEFGVDNLENLESVTDLDAVIIGAAHDVFRKNISLDNLRKKCGEKPVLADVRRMFEREKAEQAGFCYFSL